ncbi:uroporphyrinogen-III synthase [Heyndrickxia ginsengihumi]|uniref:Uroporphyrinogen-III synthase n=1 Tax=Heyndrickxia ginsengihumi TaxID=363870 RepID=A0A0A6VH42_9BACI|nr:uroporphyrinogen-III synthase [Heyndrickxia ginsengihumi]KHD86896.1 uroporphyrinogen III synthase [Heyndrickxia ginsengihumi]MBE6183839.1 uroporphyrinogen-III synthase [Bacillus sp. (in: firmicutes)]MCM3021909.1 uroporphyrinogen-III synthase [Heyndrickxia ginsengihumi]NEY20405.1 uroporphyrinogen-III synthase [Heyndrickxia ginsengihumi]
MTSDRPLAGYHILVTRGGTSGQRLAAEIQSLGGKAFIVPLIDFKQYIDRQAAHFIQQLDHYDWLVFTSQNGVKFFLKQLKEYGIHIQDLHMNMAAVGKKTKEYLETYGIQVDFVPSRFTAKAFAEEFFEQIVSIKRILLPKGNLASATIADFFRKRGIMVDEWIVYETYLPEKQKKILAKLLKSTNIHFACFTSPSSFQHFMKVIEEFHFDLNQLAIKFVSIGPVTDHTIENYGLKAAVSPDVYTIPTMLDALCQYICK